jgi:hypothetical protein
MAGLVSGGAKKSPRLLGGGTCGPACREPRAKETLLWIEVTVAQVHIGNVSGG